MARTIADFEQPKVDIDIADYPHRIEHIFQAFRNSEQQNIPVGSRLDKINTIYNHEYGKSLLEDNTSCPVTDEAEVMALMLDYTDIDKEHMLEHSPLLAAHYRTFKQAGLNVDTKQLYEYLKGELPFHLERYGLIKKLNDAEMQAYEPILERDAEEIDRQNGIVMSKKN
jgi:hypothetical protein